MTTTRMSQYSMRIVTLLTDVGRLERYHPLPSRLRSRVEQNLRRIRVNTLRKFPRNKTPTEIRKRGTARVRLRREPH